MEKGEQYDANHRKQGYLHNHWYPYIVSKIEQYGKDKRILDLACGTGIYTEPCQIGNVIGVDMSEEMIDTAKVKGLPVLRGNAYSLPFKDEAFDLVVNIGLMEYVDASYVFRETRRVLKANGTTIIVCANRHSFARVPTKVYCALRNKKYFCAEPTMRELRSSLSSYSFEVLSTKMDDGLVPFLSGRMSMIASTVVEHVLHPNPFSNVMAVIARKS